MEINRLLLITLVFTALATGGNAQTATDTLPSRILGWSEAEQTSWIKSTLAQGIPPELGGVLGSLAAHKSSLTMPLIEQKIEEVLRSPTPIDLFTDKSVDPQRFVALAVSAIEYEGNEQALRQISKLLRLDAHRFDDAVQIALMNADTFRNPFLVAYQGFEIADPALDARIVSWAEWELADKRPPIPAIYLAKRHYSYASTDPVPVADTTIQEIRHWWAEALIDRYGGVPTEAQWQSDPIVSRLPVSRADVLHKDIIPRTLEIIRKRASTSNQ